MHISNPAGLKSLFTATLLSVSFIALADGMVPETSLIIIDEATHSGTINVKNTDSHPSLLYTNVTDLPDDTGVKVIVTQPVVRLEPGQTQQLRFILQNKQPLDVEHFKRVTFEGIPPKDEKSKVGISIRQDIPALIRPASLGVVTDAWKFLKWSSNGASITVNNPSKYVVRLGQEVILLPSGVNAKLPKTYILPGKMLTAPMSKKVSGDKSVKFFPASRYGVDLPSFTSELN